MDNSIKLISLVFLVLTFLLHSCKKEELPTLSTSAISNITATSASSGGVITSDGGAEVTSRGICWGVIENPTTSDSKTNDGSGDGQFTSNLTGLTAGSIYHVRAYAINSVGTSYGADLSFTTLGKAPDAITQLACCLTPTGATLNGTVNANDLSTTVIFEYGTTTSYGQTVTATPNPVTGNSITNVNAVITGLTAGTTYYVRTYATNSIGTVYGNEINFKTPFANCGKVADVDGNIYNTVIIGTQCWMTENLKTTKFNDGTIITLALDSIEWRNLVFYLSTIHIFPGFCWYNNDMMRNKDTFGALYNCSVVWQGKVCPVGWHVPSVNEWAVMENFLGGSSEAGGHLKDVSSNHWINPNTGADNSSGFTALPGGYRNQICEFDSLGYVGYWWTSTNVFKSTDYSRKMYNNSKSILSQISVTTNGFSIRCVKD